MATEGFFKVQFASPPVPFIADIGPIAVRVCNGNDDTERAVREAGFDPSEFDRIVWPTGASRHASGRFLMDEASVEALLTTGPHQFQFGDVIFDAMWLRNPVPVMAVEADVLYAVEVVDGRFLWQYQPAELPGYNLSLDDKEKLYEETLVDLGAPYSYREAIETLYATFSAVTNSAPVFIPAGAIDGIDEFRDFRGGCKTAVDLIDSMLAQAGYVWCAMPNTDIGLSFAHRIERIPDGESQANQQITTFIDDYAGGGLHAASLERTPQNSVVLEGRVRPLRGLAVEEIPSSVDVCFPVATQGGPKYSINKDELPETDDPDEFQIRYATQQEWRYNVDFAIPNAILGLPGSNGRKISIPGTFWALFDNESDEPTNLTALELEAANFAGRYYSRFLSGACDILFRGGIPIRPWPGASEVIWSIGSTPTTRVRGSLHDPLFGWQRGRRPLSVQDIHGTGIVKVLPRQDGGMLIDVPDLTGRRIWVAKITERTLDEVNYVYKAEACDDPSIFVEDVVPIDREFGEGVPYIPKDPDGNTVDQYCEIVRACDDVLLLKAFELVETIACPSEATATFVDRSTIKGADALGSVLHTQGF